MMSEAKHNCTNVSIQKDKEKSEVEIKAEIPVEKVSEHRKRALLELGKEIKVDGFREGKVPEDILAKKIGEGALLERTANIAINEELPILLAAEEIPAIAAPTVSITKLAPGNPIGFTARAAVMPEVTLADYKKIAASHTGKKEKVDVTDDEVQETLTHLRRERAKIEKIESGMQPEEAAQVAQNMDTLELPGIDDAFVGSLGYKDAEDFKVKLRENIKNEKEMRENEKVRVAIIENVIKDSSIPLPNALVEHELDKMEGQFAADIAQSGLNLDDYLKQAGKTREEIRKEWHDSAEKRAKMQLALAEIAQKEKITADKKQVEKFVEHAKKHQPNLNEENARLYYDHALRNEATLKWLEELE